MEKAEQQLKDYIILYHMRIDYLNPRITGLLAGLSFSGLMV
jgi:hypothetical protein